jgi:phage terminase large subunit-like protein
MACRQDVSTGWKYAEDVCSGAIPAADWVVKACQRALHWREHPDELDIHFDEKAAQRVITFAGFLRHLKGPLAGRPITLEPWQIFIVTQIYGWMRNSDGLRVIRSIYIEVPRKNGKSTLCSVLALYHLIADGEQSAEVYSAATTRDQARIVFDDARVMVTRSPDLTKRLKVNRLNVAHLQSNSKFEPLSADADSLEGKSPSCSIIDELHVHKTAEVWDVLNVASGARTQPIIFAITTAGTNLHGVCYEIRDYVKKLLDGSLQDPTFFGVIYTIDESDDWRDPKAWIKANPNYNVSVQPDDIERLARQALESPRAEVNFRTKRLNQWMNASQAWIGSHDWEACNAPRPPLSEMKGRKCYMGLDLASVSDFASVALLFEIDGKLYLYEKHYLPEDTVEKASGALGQNLRTWVHEGHIVVTPGNVTDLAYIKEEVIQALEDYDVIEIAYDPWGATELSSSLLEQGAPMVKFGQSIMAMSDPAKEFEKAIKSKQLVHGSDPVLTWMMGNTVIYIDPNGNIKPKKEVEANKIDGVIAAIMALGRLKINGGVKRPSPYESRGILTI